MSYLVLYPPPICRAKQVAEQNRHGLGGMDLHTMVRKLSAGAMLYYVSLSGCEEDFLAGAFIRSEELVDVL